MNLQFYVLLLMKIIRLDPTYLKAYYRRASANYALGKLKEALRDFKAVVKIVPNDPDALAARDVGGPRSDAQ
jgi:tetratricopeptide (TPR) repeat protein